MKTQQQCLVTAVCGHVASPDILQGGAVGWKRPVEGGCGAGGVVRGAGGVVCGTTGVV